MAARPIQIRATPAKPAFSAGKGMTAAEAARHNQMFATNLRIVMDYLPKYVLGTYAATLLDEAVRATKHDSGRFAANWNLALDGAVPTDTPNPLEYNQSGSQYGSIGKKGDHRFRLAVLMAKRTYYGYRKGGNGWMELTKGKLAESLYKHAQGVAAGSSGAPRGNMTGNARRILLYNPFMKPNQRKASWFPLRSPESLARKGQGYAHYAMRKRPDLGPAGPMGSGMLQKRIYELNRELRKATAAGTLIDPRKSSML